jgi:hypothetical protein
MPRVSDNSYTPVVGDLVEVSPGFVPNGVATVTSVGMRPANPEQVRVTLRGRNSAGEVEEFSDQLHYWRCYGLRPADVPQRPLSGMQFRLASMSAYGRGPFTVTRTSSSVLYPAGDEAHGVVHFESHETSPVDRQVSQEYWRTLLTDYGYQVVDEPVTRIAFEPESERGHEPRTRVSFGDFLESDQVQETPMPYEPVVGDVVTVNDRYNRYYGTPPLVIESITACNRCPSSYDYENRTVVTVRNGDGVVHDHHLARWQERGLRLASSASEESPVVPDPPDVVIPEGSQYIITGERADQICHWYDRAFYGAGTYGYAILSRVQEEARQNARSGRALMHLRDGLVLVINCRASRYRWDFTLVDTQGVYDGNSLDEGIGYDDNGYDPYGFNYEGYDEDGYNSSGYDDEGYNRDGYNDEGFDVDGYDSDGYDEDGTDRYGDSRYDDSSDSAGLHSWDYKPSPVFYKASDDPQPSTFYGIEVEMTSDCSPEEMDVIKDLGRNEELIYPKSDGSVAGFELNTHPMTWAWAMAEFPFDIVEKLTEEGASVSERENGIHVHVSRDGFSSEAHLFRWMKFVYRNQAHAERIAGRSSDQWAGFREGHRETQKAHALNQMKQRVRAERESRGERYRSRADLESDDTTASRYSAINTCNRRTLEVRIFASTTSASLFKARVGFVAASVEYTRQLTAKAVAAGGWDWSAFRAWLLENRETYPDLAELEKVVLEEEKVETKREVQGEERRRLRREWLTSDELMSFAEFIERHDSSQEMSDFEDASGVFEGELF